MSNQPITIDVIWGEDRTATVLGRLAGEDGTGTATGVDGEGFFAKQADISSITCKVFDLTDGPNTAIATPTVTVSTHVLDSPVMTKELWTKDDFGFNFKINLAPSNFPNGKHVYRVEFEITATGGAVSGGNYEGRAAPVRGS